MEDLIAQAQQYLPIIIQAVAGAVGGNVAASFKGDMGMAGRVIATLLGAAGGAGAGQGLEYADLMTQLQGYLSAAGEYSDEAAGGIAALIAGFILPFIAQRKRAAAAA